jgi:hypothetical protein
MDALEKDFGKITHKIPGFNWLSRHSPPGWLFVPTIALINITPAFLLNLLRYDSRVALTRAPGDAAFMLLAFAAYLAAYNYMRQGITAFVVLLTFLIILGVPLAAALDGRLEAYGDWTSGKRQELFRTVVLFSDTIFDKTWTKDGDLFRSPPMPLLHKFGDQYVMVNDDTVTIVSESKLVQVEFPRD